MIKGARGLNKAQIGEMHYQALKIYLEERGASGTLPKGRDGRLKRSILCEDLKFGRSVLAQNPRIRQLLINFENNVGVISRSREEAEQRAAGGRTEREVAAMDEVKQLQTKIATLEEENRYLKAEMRRKGYADLQLPAIGRLPW